MPFAHSMANISAGGGDFADQCWKGNGLVVETFFPSGDSSAVLPDADIVASGGGGAALQPLQPPRRVQETQDSQVVLGTQASECSSSSSEGEQEASSPQLPQEWKPSECVFSCFSCFSYSFSAQSEDGTISISFDWNEATADTAFKFLTSKMLGTKRTRGMTNFLRHALKCFTKSSPTSNESAFFKGILGAGNSKALIESNLVLKRHFVSAWSLHHKDVVKAMTAYIITNPVQFHKPLVASSGEGVPQSLLPRHGEVNALARMVVLMSEPSTQQSWQEVANELRTRSASDHPEETLRARNDALEGHLLNEFYNNKAYIAPNSVNMTEFSSSIVVDPTAPPSPPKSLLWFRDTRRYLRKLMAWCQVHFVTKTGGGTHEADGSGSDSRFWRFCHNDLAVMFMWLHWKRGLDVPSHCSARLEDGLDIGVGVVEGQQGQHSPSRRQGKRFVHTHANTQTHSRIFISGHQVSRASGMMRFLRPHTL